MEFKKLPDFIPTGEGVLLDTSVQKNKKLIMGTVFGVAIIGVAWYYTRMDKSGGMGVPSGISMLPRDSLLSNLKKIPL